MKRILISVTAILIGAVAAKAQIYISEDLWRESSFKISLEARDSLTNEPVAFATAYLQPKGDTIITAFALTDQEGKAELKKVTRGEYTLSVEILGYKKYSKSHYFKEKKDLGIIKLQQDSEALDAARISAIGNPIEVRGDTIVYNASSFRVLDNAMLKDLIEKMPGMEITSDGKVKHNGEEIDRITVGGKTFFFDQTAALNNLPARFVDKVKVINQESESAQFTGVSDGKKEKVMDIDLKEEYKKGWFGSLKVGGGVNFQNKDNPLAEKNKAVFESSAMVSLFNEKDQVTVIANGANASSGDSGVAFIFDEEIPGIDDMFGLTTSYGGGVNVNTDRIPGIETNININVKGSDKDSKTISNTKEYGTADTADHNTDAYSSILTGTKSFNGGIELKKKEKKKYTVSLESSLRYSDTDRLSQKTSEVSAGDILQSTSNGTVWSKTGALSSNNKLTLGLKNLLGKEKRSLTFSGNFNFNGTSRDKTENSEIIYPSKGSDLKDLSYDLSRKGHYLSGILSYTEPFGEFWALQTVASLSGNKSSAKEDAFNADKTLNDYYSSVSENRSYQQDYIARLQFKKEGLNVQVGGNVIGLAIDNYAKSFSRETTTGEGKWDWSLSPYIRIKESKGSHNLSFFANGATRRPTDTQLSPMLDLSNPTRLSTGNIYLKPSISDNYQISYDFSDNKRQAGINLSTYSSIIRRSIVSASWFDSDGILYSIPVNAKKPLISINVNSYFWLPLSKNKKFSLRSYGYSSFASSTSYQNVSKVPQLDVTRFVYSDFMDSFWGSNGDKFYNGESGFSESLTRTRTIYESAYFMYSGERLNASVGGSVNNDKSTFSLDSRANTNYWRWVLSGSLTYSTKSAWDFSFSGAHYRFNGYEEGFGDPYTELDVTIKKNIKDWSLTFFVNDLLGQSRFYYNRATENSVVTTYHNSLGRYFMLSFSWHFGKSGSKQASRAQDAQWNMIW